MLKTSKAFKVLIATLAIVGTVSVASAADFGTTTLKVGSKGAAVTALQNYLGVTPVTGYFGPITKAKVMAWQASNGLTADGIFGAASKAKANATVGTPSTGCPAGALFNPTTGAPCATTTTVSGCTAGALFSSTTGQPCGTGSTSTVLTGTAGDATISTTTADVETDVTEGATNTKIEAFKVEADGSDIALKNVKVSLTNTNGASSKRIERYMSTVSIYEGSTLVGTANVSDFSKDGDVYSKNISLNNAVVKEGTANKATFYVTVSANSTIDSTDITNDAWKVKVSDIRFQDATGVVLTSTYTQGDLLTTKAFNFTSLASSGDVKMTISKGSASPVAQNVKVSDTSSTSGILLNEFKVKATGTPITISKINLALTGTGATPGEIASEVELKVNGSQIAVNDATLNANGTYAFTLDQDLVIPADQTVTVDVYAKINKIVVGNFGQGDSLKADYVSATTEDKNGDTVTNISGSALGEDQTFYSEGVNASGFTSSVVTTSDNGKVTKETYTVSYKLTAFGNTYYVPKSVTRAATLADDSTYGLAYTVETSAGATAAAADVTSSNSSLTSNASTVGSYFEIPDGETRTFTVTIELTPTANTGVAGFYHVQLNQALYDLDQTAVGTNEAVYTFAPAQNYETSDSKID